MFLCITSLNKLQSDQANEIYFMLSSNSTDQLDLYHQRVVLVRAVPMNEHASDQRSSGGLPIEMIFDLFFHKKVRACFELYLDKATFFNHLLTNVLTNYSVDQSK